MPRVPGASLVGALLITAAACGGAGESGREASAVSRAAVPVPEGPALVNDDWQIVQMASAHGIFTIEVELEDPDTGPDVARALIEPLADRYSEILVYVYNPGQGYGGHAPVMRITWTPEDGYDELDYRRSEQ